MPDHAGWRAAAAHGSWHDSAAAQYTESYTGKHVEEIKGYVEIASVVPQRQTSRQAA